MPSWADLNTWLTIPLAVIGFCITIYQVRKAKSAADAAKDAIDSATTQFRQVSAASITSQLSHMEDIVGRAIEKQSADLLSFAITWWKWQAGQCRAFLDTDVPDEAEFEKRIQKSITDATRLKGAMSSFDSQTDWVAATKTARKSIGDVTAQVGTFAANRSINGGNNGN